MCQGLPGSGKSTWAKAEIDRLGSGQHEAQFAIRVNKDDIRAEIVAYDPTWVWSHEKEHEVVGIRDQRIQKAFKIQGAMVVISDDTNFGRKHKTRLAQLAHECGATFEVKRFDVPVDECIRRDALREGKARVGEKVIRDMAARYGLLPTTRPTVVPYVPAEGTMSAIICDLDGTLSLFMGKRSPFDDTRCADDDCNETIRYILETFSRLRLWQIIYLSGRQDRARAATQVFLERHQCPPGPLFMRATGDTRKDSIVKAELFDAHVRDFYNVRFVLDDRNQVVDMWRSLGLTCLQVAPGDF